MPTASSIPEEVEQIINEFPDDVDLDEQAVADRFGMLVDEYRVPRDEALRTTRNYFLDEHGLAFQDLEDFNGGRESDGSADERPIVSVEKPDEWLSFTAKVVQLWDNDVDSIAQVGLIGDETGTIKCTIWASADAPQIAEDEVYRFENVVSDEYDGRLSVQVNSASEITPVEDEAADFEVGTADTQCEGALVAVQPGSGLIKRCPEDGCTRVLNNGRCSEHGQVEGEFDLRIKAVIDDGMAAYDVIFDAEATETLTGVSIEDAKQQAMDALDTEVVAETIRDQILGHAYRVMGPVIGQYLLVNECERLKAPGSETVAALAERASAL